MTQDRESRITGIEKVGHIAADCMEQLEKLGKDPGVTNPGYSPETKGPGKVVAVVQCT
jgi:hypothetical protein